jgi:hypothetical protein
MEQCPICYHELEVRECAPCDDCGCYPEELKHFEAGMHTYKIYEVYQGMRLALCDFCTVDFGSYKSEYLGFSNGQRIGFEHFTYVKDLEKPQITKDKCCPECNQRLRFINFLIAVRTMNAKQ